MTRGDHEIASNPVVHAHRVNDESAKVNRGEEASTAPENSAGVNHRIALGRTNDSKSTLHDLTILTHLVTSADSCQRVVGAVSVVTDGRTGVLNDDGSSVLVKNDVAVVVHRCDLGQDDLVVSVSRFQHCVKCLKPLHGLAQSVPRDFTVCVCEPCLALCDFQVVCHVCLSNSPGRSGDQHR